MTVVMFDQVGRDRIAAEMGTESAPPEAPIDLYGAGLEELTVHDLVEQDGAQTHTHEELVQVSTAAAGVGMRAEVEAA